MKEQQGRSFALRESLAVAEQFPRTLSCRRDQALLQSTGSFAQKKKIIKKKSYLGICSGPAPGCGLGDRAELSLVALGMGLDPHRAPGSFQILFNK